MAAIREEMKIQAGDLESIKRIKRNVNEIYEQEVAAFHNWKWLKKSIDLTVPAAIETGTVSVTEGSPSITFSSAPANSQSGRWFSVQGQIERYRILSHTAGDATAILEAPFSGETDTDLTYTVWSDRIALPVDCSETVEVTHDDLESPLEGKGLQEFRRIVNANPKCEGVPSCYHTGEPVDPVQFTAISGLPASATRASAGYVKTIVFATSVADYLEEGDRILITGAGHYSYLGTAVVVSSVSTTTITYTNAIEYTESTTADTSISISLLNQDTETEAYKELHLYPAISEDRHTLHIDYIQSPPALVEDSDEPRIPLKDRNVLVYGGLMLSWDRERFPDAAAKNEARFYNKLARMAGRIGDSTDQAKLIPSKSYLQNLRRRRRGR